MPSLTLIHSDGVETKLVLTGEQIRVGRAEDNDLVLSDDRVSLYHAVLKLGPTGDYLINDLGATNTTRVNGRPIQINALTHRDTILIGNYYVIYENEASAPPAMAPGRPAHPRLPEPSMTTTSAPAKGCFALLVITLILCLGVGSVGAALISRW